MDVVFKRLEGLASDIHDRLTSFANGKERTADNRGLIHDSIEEAVSLLDGVELPSEKDTEV